MKKSQHMPKMYVKNWLAYCISIEVQMIHTLSYSCTRLSQQPRHTHTLTHSSLQSPQNASAEKQTNKKQNTCIYIHMCVFLYDCMRSESESASHSSPPQLKGV